MGIKLAAAVVAAVALFSVGGRVDHGDVEAANGNIRVTSSADSGAGSLRAALATAAANTSPTTITLAISAPISLNASLAYTGAQALTIQTQGNSQAVIQSSPTQVCADGDALLAVTGGADVKVNGVTFASSACHGLFVNPPSTRTGTMEITLRSVAMRDLGDAGLMVRDTNQSSADFDLKVVSSTFERVGADPLKYAAIDVAESAAGSVSLVLTDSTITGSAFYAISSVELDAGAFDFRVSGSTLSGNGTASAFNSGAVFAAESGDGDMRMRLADSAIRDNPGRAMLAGEAHGGNFEVVANGFQVTNNASTQYALIWYEGGAGDADITMTDATLTGPGTNGLAMVEDGIGAGAPDGNLTARLTRVSATGFSSSGITLQEAAAGNASITAVEVNVSNNTGNGLELTEADAGTLTTRVRRSNINGNGLDGLVERETGDGNLDARVRRTSVGNNGDDGIEVSQSDDGVGTLRLRLDTIEGNGDQAVVLNGVVAE